MQSPSGNTLERLLQSHVLSLFLLPDGELVWQGESVLTTEIFLYYFRIDNDNYLLVNEPIHGAGDNALKDLLIGNAVVPRQTVVAINAKENARPYVNLSKTNIEKNPRLTGDFSIFRILG